MGRWLSWGLQKALGLAGLQDRVEGTQLNVSPCMFPAWPVLLLGVPGFNVGCREASLEPSTSLGNFFGAPAQSHGGRFP